MILNLFSARKVIFFRSSSVAFVVISPKGKYFYDANTNAIVGVTSRLYEYLNGGTEYPLDHADTLKELETLTWAGMLSTDKWEAIEHPATMSGSPP